MFQDPRLTLLPLLVPAHSLGRQVSYQRPQSRHQSASKTVLDDEFVLHSWADSVISQDSLTASII
jgi:hypothetical protein